MQPACPDPARRRPSWPPRRSSWSHHRPPGWRGTAPRGPVGPLVLPVVLALVQVSGSRAAGHGQPGARPLDWLGYLLLLAGPAALLFRRSQLACLVVAVAATTGYFTLGYPRGPGFLAAIVALFGAVQRGQRVAAWAAAGAGWLVWALAGRVWSGAPGGAPLARPGLADMVFVAAWLLVVLAMAEAARVRRAHFAELATARAERQRAEEQQEQARIDHERRRASEERLRIARELHDVLGHHLSLINVQAGVGLHLMDERPELARSALTEIKKASSEALREVRAVLAALRPADESAPRTPAPGIAELDALVAGVRAAGLPVKVGVAGAARSVPAEVDRAIYRIVQEALTNVRRHAGPDAGVSVEVRYAPAAIEVFVVDDGARGGAADGEGGARGGAADGEGGAGLAGMRERVAALGGQLRAGPRPAGGFEVYGRLPTGEEDR